MILYHDKQYLLIFHASEQFRTKSSALGHSNHLWAIIDLTKYKI